MKIKYIREGYFKTPEQAKQSRNNSSGLERVSAVAKSQINDFAGQRFNVEFTEYLTGVNGIFKKEAVLGNGARCESIEYYFENNILVCKFNVSLSSGGDLNTGDALLYISYPENIREIEQSLKEEYGFDSKIIISLSPKQVWQSAPKNPIFTKQKYYSDRKKVSLELTDCTDLTDFCHLLNCIEGIDFDNYVLYIDITDGKGVKEFKSSEPLIQKFQEVKVFGAELEQLNGIDCVLSNKPCSEYHNNSFAYNGTSVDNPTIPQFTGVLFITLDDETGYTEPQSFTYDKIIDIANSYAKWAKTYMSSYKNLLVVLDLNNHEYIPETENSYFAKDTEDILFDKRLVKSSNLSLAIHTRYEHARYSPVRLFNLSHYDPDRKKKYQ